MEQTKSKTELREDLKRARVSEEITRPNLRYRNLEVHIPIGHRYGEVGADGVNLYTFVEREAELLERGSRYGGGCMIDGVSYEIAIRMHVDLIEKYIAVLEERDIPFRDLGLCGPLRNM